MSLWQNATYALSEVKQKCRTKTEGQTDWKWNECTNEYVSWSLSLYITFWRWGVDVLVCQCSFLRCILIETIMSKVNYVNISMRKCMSAHRVLQLNSQLSLSSQNNVFYWKIVWQGNNCKCKSLNQVIIPQMLRCAHIAQG